MAWKSHLLTLFLFAVVGPGVGLLAFAVLGGGSVPLGAELGLMLLFAYGIGLLPAALAGMLFSPAWRQPAPIPMFGAALSAVLLGAAAGVVAFSAVAWVLRGDAMPASVAVLVVPMFAGAVCGVLAYRLHRRDEGFSSGSGNAS